MFFLFQETYCEAVDMLSIFKVNQVTFFACIYVHDFVCVGVYWKILCNKHSRSYIFDNFLNFYYDFTPQANFTRS